jgi:hypothetical protein
MSEKNSGNISIANIIALVGLAGIGVITFFGLVFHSPDGKSTVAVLGAVAFVALLGFLLFMSIKAKGAEDNPDKWRYVEWACLALYVVAAIVFASPFQRFFHIVSEKENMQAQARQEVQAIKTLYQNYDSQQKKFLDDAVQQLQNYAASGQRTKVKDELAEYATGVGTNIEGWAAKASAVVKMQPDKQLQDIEEQIENWNYMQLASLAADLEEKDASAWSDLEAKIKSYGMQNKLIPVISGGGSVPYKWDGYAQFDLGTKPEAKFTEMLRTADGSTVLGWIIYIILNLMVLLNYVVASRTGFVGPVNRKTPSGGLDL